MNYPKQNELDFLCVLLGGSTLYGLRTPTSDSDFRGVYLNSRLGEVVGITNNETQGQSKEEGDDFSYFSLLRFFELLKKTNTNTIEILFAPEYLLITEDFNRIKEKRTEFVDSYRLIKSCQGYVISETRLTLGERTGRLGGKRQEQVQKWGYSPKNAASIIRIIGTLKEFLKTGEWACVVTGELKKLSMDLKLNPEKFSVDDVKELVENARIEVDSLTDTLGMKFNVDLAAEMMWDIYKRKFK